MKMPMKMGCWIVVLVVAVIAIGLGVLSNDGSVTRDTLVTGSDVSGADNGNALTLVERIGAPPSVAPIPVQSQGATAAYSDYKKKQTCFSLRETTVNELNEEIASLQEVIKQYSPSVRKSYESEIDLAKNRLQQKNACMMEGKILTKDELRSLLAGAAAAGDRDAQLEYAMRPMFNALHAIPELESMREWKKAAPRYVEVAVDQGDPQAILLLAEASDPYRCRAAKDPECGGAFRYAVRSDPVTSYRYYRFLQLVASDEAPSWVLQEMSALKSLISTNDLSWAEHGAQQDYQSLPRNGSH